MMKLPLTLSKQFWSYRKRAWQAKGVFKKIYYGSAEYDLPFTFRTGIESIITGYTAKNYPPHYAALKAYGPVIKNCLFAVRPDWHQERAVMEQAPNYSSGMQQGKGLVAWFRRKQDSYWLPARTLNRVNKILYGYINKKYPLHYAALKAYGPLLLAADILKRPDWDYEFTCLRMALSREIAAKPIDIDNTVAA